MRAREFVREGVEHGIQQGVARALPASYNITSLPNQDNYLQYRFTVAMAGAKGRKKRAEDGIKDYDKISQFGRNQVVISYDPDVGEWIDDALDQMGLPAQSAELVSTTQSEEQREISNTRSPVKGFKGYPR